MTSTRKKKKMKHETLIKRIEKIGIKVENHDDRRFVARGKTNNVSWYKQGDRAVCVSTASPYTDSSTDCFCDIFHRTIKSAVTYLSK